MRILRIFDLGHPMASVIDRDNSDHIPITFVDSWTLVVALVTDYSITRSDPAAARAPPTLLQRITPDSHKSLEFLWKSEVIRCSSLQRSVVSPGAEQSVTRTTTSVPESTNVTAMWSQSSLSIPETIAWPSSRFSKIHKKVPF